VGDLLQLKRFGFAYVLLLPLLIVVAFVDIWPTLWAVRLSTWYKYLLNPGKDHFIGLGNYLSLAHDPLFWQSLKQGLIYTVSVTILQAIVGLIVALALNAPIKGRAFFRAILMVPWVIPGATAALMWMWILNALVGVFNDILVYQLQLVAQPIAFLAMPKTALPSLIGVTVWVGFAFNVIMILAALQAIPEDSYDAAAIDGANEVQSLRYITLPAISETLGITMLLTFMWAFNYMDLVYIMTRGGPVHYSETLASYSYKLAMVHWDLGMGAASSVVIMVLLAVFAAVYIWRVQTQEV
jgi:ABC-type sugar transport system permease subunit